MSIQIAPKNCTTVLAHCFSAVATYLQEYGVNFAGLGFLCYICCRVQGTEKLTFLYTLDKLEGYVVMVKYLVNF